MTAAAVWKTAASRPNSIMSAPTEPESESESRSARIGRLQKSSSVFIWATQIGCYVLLYSVGLLVASIFVRSLHILWIICFLFSVLALCGHLAAWLILSYRSMGYGISSSFLFWEYWLLALASGVSTFFAFSSYQRYLVLLLLVGGIWLSTRFIPMLWVVPWRAIGRSLGLVR
jgi:hypothetical protein